MNHIRRAKDKYPFIIRVMKDYIIIGSGGAVFSSAIEAVKYGAKVAMIERGTIGEQRNGGTVLMFQEDIKSDFFGDYVIIRDLILK